MKTQPALPGSCRKASICGFTLIELLVVLAIAGILACLAYPSLARPVLRVRRGEGLLALMQMQQAQERWRADHTSYAVGSDLGIAASTSSGRYRLSVQAHSASGYTLLATATSTQMLDTPCTHLQLEAAGGNLHYRSGATSTLDNTEHANRRCWNQ